MRLVLPGNEQCPRGQFPGGQFPGRKGWRGRAPGSSACRRRAARHRPRRTSMRMPASSARSCSSRSRVPAAKAAASRSARAPRGDRRRGRQDGRAALLPRARSRARNRAHAGARRDLGADGLDPRWDCSSPPRRRSRRRAWRCRPRRFSSGASAARIVSGSIVGRSPWTLTTTDASPAPHRPCRAPRRSGRSRTRGRSASSRPRSRGTGRIQDGLRIRPSRRRRGRYRPSRALRATWTIIGTPAMSASGLPEGAWRPCGPNEDEIGHGRVGRSFGVAARRSTARGVQKVSLAGPL